MATLFITGGNRGIGLAILKRFAAEGYNIVVSTRKQYPEFESKCREMENIHGVTIHHAYMELDNPDSISHGLKNIDALGIIPDVVVNNAGIVYDRNFDEITVSEFKRTLEVNVIGAFIVSREVSRYMKKGSTIVNVSSTNGTKTISPECLDYNISKIGLQSLTRDLAFQFKPNIRVNAIAIGWADTDMNKDLPKEYIKDEISKIYVERFADPSEIAKTIYFLASDESSYINSEIVNIDGGYC